MSRPSDEILVDASRNGDKGAYAQLMHWHYRRVLAVCVGVLGSVHDAEDAVQETMLKGYVEIGRLRDSSCFGAWICRIARNESINTFRKRKRVEKVRHDRPEDKVAKETDHERLALAIRRLSKEDRLPLSMYYFDGRDVKGIARSLGVSPGSIYVRLRRAMEQLHGFLTEQEVSDER